MHSSVFQTEDGYGKSKWPNLWWDSCRIVPEDGKAQWRIPDWALRIVVDMYSFSRSEFANVARFDKHVVVKARVYFQCTSSTSSQGDNTETPRKDVRLSSLILLTFVCVDQHILQLASTNCLCGLFVWFVRPQCLGWTFAAWRACSYKNIVVGTMPCWTEFEWRRDHCDSQSVPLIKNEWEPSLQITSPPDRSCKINGWPCVPVMVLRGIVSPWKQVGFLHILLCNIWHLVNHIHCTRRCTAKEGRERDCVSQRTISRLLSIHASVAMACLQVRTRMCMFHGAGPKQIGELYLGTSFARKMRWWIFWWRQGTAANIAMSKRDTLVNTKCSNA